jgi:hypothetical protein
MDKLTVIKALLSDDEQKYQSENFTGSKIKIAILQRGWVVIGEYSENGDECILRNASVIRKWGTSEGLGELAIKGKQTETKLDKTGVVRFNKLTSVALIDCDKIWENQL